MQLRPDQIETLRLLRDGQMADPTTIPPWTFEDHRRPTGGRCCLSEAGAEVLRLHEENAALRSQVVAMMSEEERSVARIRAQETLAAMGGKQSRREILTERDTLRAALEEAALVLAAEQGKVEGAADLYAPDLDLSWVPENQSWRVYLGDIETAELIAWIEPADLDQIRGKGYCARGLGWDVEVAETNLGMIRAKGHVETARDGIRLAISMLRASLPPSGGRTERDSRGGDK